MKYFRLHFGSNISALNFGVGPVCGLGQSEISLASLEIFCQFSIVKFSFGARLGAAKKAWRMQSRLIFAIIRSQRSQAVSCKENCDWVDRLWRGNGAARGTDCRDEAKWKLQQSKGWAVRRVLKPHKSQVWWYVRVDGGSVMINLNWSAWYNTQARTSIAALPPDKSMRGFPKSYHCSDPFTA